VNARTAAGRLAVALAAEALALLAVRRLLPGTGGTEGLDVAADVARQVATVLLVYLLVITALQLIALAAGPTRAGGTRLAALAAALGPRTVAGVAATALATTAAACAPAPPTSVGPPHDGRDHSAMVMVLEDPGSGTVAPPPADDPRITMELLAGPPPATAAAVPRTVTVERGHSLWSLAEGELAERFGRAPTDAETATYWRLVVELNRPRLVDPHDPGRIYAGQRIVLP
jgi:hypothetical protein